LKTRKKAWLILENGDQFEGQSFGFEGNSSGEVVFNTSMTGFELSLTDPSYYGQILTFTFPLVGNFGVPDSERDEYGLLKFFESEKIWPFGVIMTNASENFSHHRAVQSLENFLKKQKIPAITCIDTRKLTKILRDKGSLLGQIVIDKKAKLNTIKDPNQENLVDKVSIKKTKIYTPKNFKKTILLIDTGVKNNIIRCFLKRKIRVVQVPWDTVLKDFNFKINQQNIKINGLFLSNGPGDPKKVFSKITANISLALEKNIPIFGICLGNQILSLALGGNTYKLPYGHRGVNQPVQNLENEKCFITSQNHGFAVDEKKLPKDFKVWFKNLNDGSVEGIKHIKKPIFSVQFHPEACPGPQDTEFLFDEFLKNL